MVRLLLVQLANRVERLLNLALGAHAPYHDQSFGGLIPHRHAPILAPHYPPLSSNLRKRSHI